eukprot:511334-Pleurochrysis_carterae.AAC.1
MVSSAYVVRGRGLFRRFRESRRNGRRRGLRRNARCADYGCDGRRPGEVGFVKIYVGGNDDAQARHVNVEGTRGLMVAAKVDTNPGTRIHACLREGRLGFDSEGFATEWHDAHDRRFDTSDDFK